MTSYFPSRTPLLVLCIVVAVLLSVYFSVRLELTSQVVMSNYKFRYRTNDIDANSTGASGPLFIVIMAQWRFGSSAVGELFNQNPHSFYLFEPLWTTSALRKEKHIKRLTPESTELSRNILRNFEKCQFSDAFVHSIQSWGGLKKNAALCRVSRNCSITSAKWLSSLCGKYRASPGWRATKLIRADLELLRPLVEKDGINMKIIHLVRDPRAAAASRIAYSKVMMTKKPKLADPVGSDPQSSSELGRLVQLQLLKSTQEMCQWIRDNAKLSPERLPSWLQGRYHLVKYEDFADNPLEVTQSLYKFVGTPLPEEVKVWVKENTHTSSENLGIFSTKKDSRAAARHWMSDLRDIEIRQIETECSDVLELMKYEPYSRLKLSQNL